MEAPPVIQPEYIFKCRKRNDENINEFFCCMYCEEEAEYMAGCWEYNVKDMNGKWVGRWDNLERVE